MFYWIRQFIIDLLLKFGKYKIHVELYSYQSNLKLDNEQDIFCKKEKLMTILVFDKKNFDIENLLDDVAFKTAKYMIKEIFTFNLITSNYIVFTSPKEIFMTNKEIWDIVPKREKGVMIVYIDESTNDFLYETNDESLLTLKKDENQ